jgi:hypothetical protein
MDACGNVVMFQKTMEWRRRFNTMADAAEHCQEIISKFLC